MSPLTCGWIPHSLPCMSLPSPSSHVLTIITQATASLSVLWSYHDMPRGSTGLMCSIIRNGVEVHLWTFLYKLYTSVTGFLNVFTIDIRGWLSLCCGDRPIHRRVLSSTVGLHPQDASKTPHPKLWQLKMSPGFAKCPWQGGDVKSLSAEDPCSTRTQKVKSMLKPVI